MMARTSFRLPETLRHRLEAHVLELKRTDPKATRDGFLREHFEAFFADGQRVEAQAHPRHVEGDYPDAIFWCRACPGAVFVWGGTGEKPPPRCPECHGNDFAEDVAWIRLASPGVDADIVAAVEAIENARLGEADYLEELVQLLLAVDSTVIGRMRLGKPPLNTALLEAAERARACLPATEDGEPVKWADTWEPIDGEPEDGDTVRKPEGFPVHVNPQSAEVELEPDAYLDIRRGWDGWERKR